MVIVIKKKDGTTATFNCGDIAKKEAEKKAKELQEKLKGDSYEIKKDK